MLKEVPTQNDIEHIKDEDNLDSKVREDNANDDGLQVQGNQERPYGVSEANEDLYEETVDENGIARPDEELEDQGSVNDIDEDIDQDARDSDLENEELDEEYEDKAI